VEPHLFASAELPSTGKAVAPTAPAPMRLFIGIKIESEIARELARIARPIENTTARPVPIPDIHLTLVAPWRETDAEAAIRKLRCELEPFACFDLVVERVTYGSNTNRLKFLWAECAATSGLEILQKRLSSAFGILDSRPFRPHVTLARLGDDGRKIARKYPIDCPVSLKQRVCAIELFRSPQEQGRGYEILASIPLREEAPPMDGFISEISRHVWETKYRFAEPGAEEVSISDSWRRVARALAAIEPRDQSEWEQRFFSLLQGFKFLPGGRIQAGAGTGRNVTLFNCFVMGTIEDSIPGIFSALQESATTMQQGGGIGCDFSTLRPRGSRARGVGSIASGPVSFMRVWDSMCATILSTGARRGAMMATLRCDHPDIEEFVVAKQAAGALRHFNLSVLITDEFMAAVRADAPWPLLFPAASLEADGPLISRSWSATHGAVPCRIIRQVSARTLWQKILTAAYDYAEPGVLFIDRINRNNNLLYKERIDTTNPCGEVPLPPYGACDLGSLNLVCFVRDPFTQDARFDFAQLKEFTRDAVRLLDNVIDASRFPLPQQAAQAKGSRRIGLGITGLADALLMLGRRYGDEPSLALAAEIMRCICYEAYRASVALAEEKGSLPFFDRDKYLQAPFVQKLPDDIRDGVAKNGIRNSHLLAIAPTGTISLLAGNVSSGLEPIFAASYTRGVLGRNGETKSFTLSDYALAKWREREKSAGLPHAFVTAASIPPTAHLAMQATLQPFVDNSISKTINVPEEFPFEDFRKIYDIAYDSGLKGCTVYRPNPVRGAVLSEGSAGMEAPHCCVLEREGD
jgi:ribonucleoside-diphosphate reductase alpha chain